MQGAPIQEGFLFEELLAWLSGLLVISNQWLHPECKKFNILFPFQILTKDSVTVAVDAVVYFRIHDATTSITNVENANRSTRLLAQTTLRNVLGTKNLSEILADREVISHVMQVRNFLYFIKMVSFVA